MEEPDFRRMTPEEFKAFRPLSPDEAKAREAEARFRDWCAEGGADPAEPGARHTHEAEQRVFREVEPPEDDGDDDDAEAEFRSWCEQTGEDPTDPEVRDGYEEQQEELGGEFWENLSPEDRAGWEDNMHSFGD